MRLRFAVRHSGRPAGAGLLAAASQAWDCHVAAVRHVQVAAARIHDMVSNFEIFHNLPEAFCLALVEALQPRQYQPGEIVYSEGEQGSEMYFVESGDLAMMDQKFVQCIATMSTGACFGEVASALPLPAPRLLPCPALPCPALPCPALPSAPIQW
jgi:hypothetical protein